MEYLYLIITILSLSASILAWVAKIRWSSEYRQAKEAQISSIKEQIVFLKEQNSQMKEYNSDKIMSLYLSTKEGLEILNDKILAEKEVLEEKVQEMNDEIDKLKIENQNQIKVPDFSYLNTINLQLNNSLKLFATNSAMKFEDLTTSLEELKRLKVDNIYYKPIPVSPKGNEEE